MNRKYFLDNFRKHLKRYGWYWRPEDIIRRLEMNLCPLPIEAAWTDQWWHQTKYYDKHRRTKGKLIDQMISIVKKFYKIKEI